MDYCTVDTSLLSDVYCNFHSRCVALLCPETFPLCFVSFLSFFLWAFAAFFYYFCCVLFNFCCVLCTFTAFFLFAGAFLSWASKRLTSQQWAWSLGLTLWGYRWIKACLWFDFSTFDTTYLKVGRFFYYCSWTNNQCIIMIYCMRYEIVLVSVLLVWLVTNKRWESSLHLQSETSSLHEVHVVCGGRAWSTSCNV